MSIRSDVWPMRYAIFNSRPNRGCFVADIVLRQLLSEKAPFHDVRSDIQLVGHILSGKRLSRPPGDALQDDWWIYIQSCCSDEPEKRPTMADVVEKFKAFRQASEV